MKGFLLAMLIVSNERVAMLDGMNNRVTVDGQAFTVAESPVDAIFVGDELFVLSRDANVLQRLSDRASVTVAPDSAFVREGNGLIYVYSRRAGVFQEIDPTRLQITRRIDIAPFASDLEVAGTTAYLVYPRDAVIRLIDLTKLEAAGEIKAGAVPVDLAITRASNAVSATTLSIADPSAKRVWSIEGRQSVSAAVARGFLGGLLGLGLFAPRSAEFPTGVDRVFPGGFAYDTSSQTLYRVRSGKATVVAKDVAPSSLAATERGVVVWKDGAVQHLR